MTMKTKKNSRFHILRNNRGSSIVCALGVLTVILIVVMLFASKAKVSSTISAIQLENQTARALAKSLIPRIMLTINNSPDVQDQILYSSIYDVSSHKTYAGENLYSYDWLWKLEHPAHIKFTTTERKNGIITSMGTFAYYSDSKGKGPKFEETRPYVPTWQYILDIPAPKDESNIDGTLPYRERNAIARFAYIIIPKIAHLNPSAIADHTLCKKLSSTSVNVKGISHDSCRKCARKLGNSGAELMFAPASGSTLNADMKNLGDGYYISSPIAQAFTENNRIKWSAIQDFMSDFGITPPGLDASDEEIDRYINNKNTVTRFLDVDNVGDREAYWSDDGYEEDGKKIGNNDKIPDPQEFYHRFNMRRTDWENLEISDIIAAPKFWNNPSDLQEPGITGIGNRNNFDTGGIAWLRNWDDGGDWNDKEATKNQVIANLLNYCSPPTRPVVSNVKPEKWNEMDSPGNELDEQYEPTYTGLKRTLYLNEYSYDLQFTPQVELGYDPTGDETTVKVAYNFQSEFMVELVDMYLNTLGDTKNNPVKFKTTMDKPDFSTYHPEIYGTLTFEYWNPKPVTNSSGKTSAIGFETKEYSIHGNLEGKNFKRFEDHPGIHKPVDRNKRTYGYYGYFTIKNDQIRLAEYKLPGNISDSDFYKGSINIPDPNDSDKTIKLDTQPKIRKVVLKIDKILLYREPTNDEKEYLQLTGATDNFDAEKRTFPRGLPNDKEYVDCARISQKYKDNRGQEKEFVESVATVKRFNDKDGFYAICGHREAIDPRQNLRLCDWDDYKSASNASTYVTYPDEDAYLNGYAEKDIYGNAGAFIPPFWKLHSMPIQTSTTTNGITTDDNVTGTNECLNTKSAKIKKSDSNVHDCEATQDPAWKMEKGVKMPPTSFDSHISTAFIRHAVLRRVDGNSTSATEYPLVEHPMESLWELGAIHRGSRWQTLNLSQSPEYTSAEDFVKKGAGEYKYGDAPILDQVKMTNDCISYGKVNLVRHVDAEVRNTVIGALFRDMPVHKYGYYLSQGLDDSGSENLTLYPNKDYSSTMTRIYDKDDDRAGLTIDKGPCNHIAYVVALYDVLFGDAGNLHPLKNDGIVNPNKLWRRTDFLAAPKRKGSAQDPHVISDILYPIRQQSDGNITDAMEEQIIGRTVNLMKIDSSIKGATAILVVQTLKDSGSNTTVYKDWDNDGKIIPEKPVNGKVLDLTNKNLQLQSGYRRFSDRESADKPFFQPPETQKETIKTGPFGKGTYQNGADSITGEVKVVVTLDFDTATQKWKMTKYEYAE